MEGKRPMKLEWKEQEKKVFPDAAGVGGRNGVMHMKYFYRMSVPACHGQTEHPMWN